MATQGWHGPQVDGEQVVFRLWAPRAAAVAVHVNDERVPMVPEDRGWRTATAKADHGARYGFRLDDGGLVPDPASRWQPDGVHAASAVFDPVRLRWTDHGWRAPPLSAAVFYELHIGTFTPEGTFAAAIPHLSALRDLGVTHVEVMPVNAFNGEHGWGYDGVYWYAVHEPYGGPEGFAAFVDACHADGLAVCLDAVYNHLGPSGNYLPECGPYLTDRYATPWGQAVNLDGPGADGVRSLIVGSALAWLRDYHVDALRLDAVHGFIDTSAVHILAELSDAVADLAAQLGRPLQLIAESDRQDPQTVRPRLVGGQGLDAQWADDLHHSIHVAVTGERDGYYADYTGLRDVAAAYRHGFVHGGSYSTSRDRTIGAPLPDDVAGWRLVGCIQNHDQVGNRARGRRLTDLVDPSLARIAAALLCLAPHTPLLFMGEEYGETRPFQYFTSHPEPELAGAVREGRRAEFAGFAAFGGEVPDPQDPGTFAASVLDRSRSETPEGHARRALWLDLLALRRSEPALASGDRSMVDVLLATPTQLAMVRHHDTRPLLIAANLAAETAVVDLTVDGQWSPLWSSDDHRYGGTGTSPSATATDGGFTLEIPPIAVCLFADD